MGLLELPPELLLRVSSYLTTPELGYFRRTCKYVEATLFDSFAREFFTKRQFMIEHVSLQALIDIANHPTLSQRLSQVIIGLDTLPLDPDQPYPAEHVSRSLLLETGQACDMLVEAIPKLPNLRTVGMRDYNARGRHRDGEDAVWRSYGWSYGIKNDPNMTATQHLSQPSIDLAAPESTLPLICSALGRAHAKPDSLEVILRRRPKLTPTSFDVFTGAMATQFVPVLASLKKVMLTIALDGSNRFGAPWLPYDDSNQTDAPLKRFILHLPSLETLRLNFRTEQFLAYRFLEWLGCPASPSVPAASSPHQHIPPVSLTNLTGLDLGMLNVAAPTLLLVLTKFNLTSLNLWKITLHCADAELLEEPDCWAFLLRDLSAALPLSTNLKSVFIGNASQGSFVATVTKSVRIYFTPPKSDPNKQRPTEFLDTAAYRAAYGSSVNDWLRDLATSTALKDLA
ncbi:hypothetical protein MBLNU459_g3847t1 [Dothideomycetes sp. NU459]